MESDYGIGVKRTDSSNEDFKQLVVLLDEELGNTYSEEYDFYNQFNQIDEIKNVVVVYKGGIPSGCGAIKKYDSETMEVKRMYTKKEYRGMGIASIVLNELEKWSKEMQYTKCILETGTEQHAAMALYQKKGYELIPNYGQYSGVPTSICYLKTLK